MVVSIPNVNPGDDVLSSWGNLVGDTVEYHDSVIGGITNLTWTPYTPTWLATGTALSAGNATIAGEYKIIGDWCFFRTAITYGSTTTAGTGNWTVSLPVLGSSSLNNRWPLGNWHAFDTSASQLYVGVVLSDTTLFKAVAYTPGSPAVPVGVGAPITWATGDTFIQEGIYRI